MSLECFDTPLPGLRLVHRRLAGDSRGFFARLFSLAELRACGWGAQVTQVNHSYTAKRGTVRGLHFQMTPYSDAKLVQCIRGEVWDVAVDLRRNSPTFLQWHAERLSAENGRGLFIPQGYAHGFQTLADDTELIYCHSADYMPAAEGGLHFLDERLAITWPETVTEVSARDRAHAFVDTGFEGLEL